MLFQLREEVDELKGMLSGGVVSRAADVRTEEDGHAVRALPVRVSDMPEFPHKFNPDYSIVVPAAEVSPGEEKEETPRTIQDVSDDMIRRALEKHEGRRKAAAAELGISERTLYRKIKELKINDK